MFLDFLLDQAAFKLRVDLTDRVFDWSVKAILIKKHPQLYKKLLCSKLPKRYAQCSYPSLFDQAGNIIFED